MELTTNGEMIRNKSLVSHITKEKGNWNGIQRRGIVTRKHFLIH